MYVTALASYLSTKKKQIENQSTFSHGRREKACDVRFLPCREEYKGVIEFFNYTKSTVYDQWNAWNSFKKNYAHRKKRSRSLGSPRPTSLSPRWAAPSRPSQHHQQGPGLQFVQEEAPAHKSRETQAWMLENLPTTGARTCGSPDCNPHRLFLLGMVENKTNKHAHNTLDSLRAAIVEEFANMKKDVVGKACGRFRHRLEMLSPLMGAILKNKIYICVPFI
ncbi:Uncharacterized protein FKW44_008609 [Caligus rogercresseyi]|uniref:Uncharacterized protein n=1 Tax=Caligus rogercresseyi TaxID=217165 RepID=A0A7T8QUD6_CALRO|nr:Uncharacterized protein FKW44_008609 [Caligus rogercresseyi]